MRTSRPLMLVLFALFTVAAYGQTEPRYSDTAARFSVQPPVGWTIGKNDKGDPTVWGPKSGSITPNLNFRHVTSELTLDKFADASIKYILDHYKDMGTESTALESRGKFNTTSGIAGVKIIFVSAYKGFNIKTTQYLFPRGQDKYLLTFTSLANETTDAAFDTSVRSFRFDK